MILATSRVAVFLWIVLPYLAIATFVVGHVWRFRRDQFTWTTRSTQLLESRLLKFGGPLFHYGLLAVIGGHVIGILIPQSFTESLGISESLYRDFSATMGTLAGTAMLAGLLILLYRRATDRRVQATTRRMDVAVLALLAFMAATGMWNTVFENVVQGGYKYRATVSPWFRGLFLLDPKASLMSGGAIPLSYQLHAVAGWLLIGLWPFTRLVHAWSVPLAYIRRRPIVYRARAVGRTPKSKGAVHVPQ
jgi:respiratory nitrate reductase gamma subunit